MNRTQKTPDQRHNSSDPITKKDILLLSAKIDRNQKALDQPNDVAQILPDNEQNFKNLGGLQHYFDTLDKILVTVDKIAGSIQTYQQEQVLNSEKLSNHDDRLEIVEKRLHIPVAA